MGMPMDMSSGTTARLAFSSRSNFLFPCERIWMLCEDDDCVRLPAALPHALSSAASGEVDGLIIRRTFSAPTNLQRLAPRRVQGTALPCCTEEETSGERVLRDRGRRMICVNTSHSVPQKRCNKRQETHLLLTPSPCSSTASLVPSSSTCRLIESNSVQLSASLHILLLVGTLTSVCAAGSDASHARINNLQQKCDRMFSSKPGTAKNGSFTSPSFQNNANHSRQCIYTFEAAENERVEVTFTSFNLRGAHPEYVSDTKTHRMGEDGGEKTCPFSFYPITLCLMSWRRAASFFSPSPSLPILPLFVHVLFLTASLPSFLSTFLTHASVRDSVPNDISQINAAGEKMPCFFLLSGSNGTSSRRDSAGIGSQRKHLPLISIFC